MVQKVTFKTAKSGTENNSLAGTSIYTYIHIYIFTYIHIYMYAGEFKPGPKRREAGVKGDRPYSS